MIELALFKQNNAVSFSTLHKVNDMIYLTYNWHDMTVANTRFLTYVSYSLFRQFTGLHYLISY